MRGTTAESILPMAAESLREPGSRISHTNLTVFSDSAPASSVSAGEQTAEEETSAQVVVQVSSETSPADHSAAISAGMRGLLIGLAAAAAVIAIAAVRIAYVRKKREAEKERRERERARRRKRQELAARQEEELLRQIEMLTEKSRKMKDEPSDGLRIIELNPEEQDEISRSVDEEMRNRKENGTADPSREAGGKEAQSGEDWPDSGEDPDSFGDEDSDEDGVYDSDGEISDEQLDAWLSQMQDDEEGEDDSDGGLPDGGNDGHQD